MNGAYGELYVIGGCGDTTVEPGKGAVGSPTGFAGCPVLRLRPEAAALGGLEPEVTRVARLPRLLFQDRLADLEGFSLQVWKGVETTPLQAGSAGTVPDHQNSDNPANIGSFRMKADRTRRASGLPHDPLADAV